MVEAFTYPGHFTLSVRSLTVPEAPCISMSLHPDEIRWLIDVLEYAEQAQAARRESGE